MKIHNYGNDYVQGMKFKNQKANATNGSVPKAGEAGGEEIEVKKEKEGTGGQESKKNRQNKQQDKREKAGEGTPKKQEELQAPEIL